MERAMLALIVAASASQEPSRPPVVTVARELPAIRSVQNVDDELPGKVTKKLCKNCSIYCSCGCQLGRECKCQVHRGEHPELGQAANDPSRGIGVTVAPLAQPYLTQPGWAPGIGGLRSVPAAPMFHPAVRAASPVCNH